MQKENKIDEIIIEEETTHNKSSASYVMYKCMKRAFDFLSSLLLGLVLLLPCCIVALVIMAVDPGNPIFIQERIGKDGKIIKMAKFRSMVKNADNLKNVLTTEQYEQYVKEFKLADDPRLLPKGVGEFIRRTSIDEIPQIIYNICIKGDMSVVGPRPIVYKELMDKYTPEQQKKLLSVKPGLTGYWQAYARNNAGYGDGKRQEMELYYVDNCSIWLDIKILFKTISTVLSKSGAQ